MEKIKPGPNIFNKQSFNLLVKDNFLIEDLNLCNCKKIDFSKVKFPQNNVNTATLHNLLPNNHYYQKTRQINFI